MEGSLLEVAATVIGWFVFWAIFAVALVNLVLSLGRERRGFEVRPPKDESER